MITHLELDILEGKWALGSITTNKATGGDRISAELLKCYIQHASKLGKLGSANRTGNGQLSLKSQKRAMPKSVQTTAQLQSFHMLAFLVTLKILQARLQQYTNGKLPVVQT